MKPMMQSRYVSWMAVRPLDFGGEHFEPGDKIPQRHLEPMRDPEVLVRTNRIAAVAKDMNKVPRYLRKDVTDEAEMRAKILAPRIASQIGPHEVGVVAEPEPEEVQEPDDAPEDTPDPEVEEPGEPEDEGGETPDPEPEVVEGETPDA